MPLVTFSSPLHKDKTVYAIAGSHTKTLLELAKENLVEITQNDAFAQIYVRTRTVAAETVVEVEP